MAAEIVIVGGGPAGFATARAYRESGGDGDVTLLCEEPRAPYQRPPLSKEFLRGQLEIGELALEQDAWFAANDVHLRLGVSALAINLRERTVTTGEGELTADAIVLATGSAPLRPPIPGAENPSVMTFRTLPDSLRLALRTRPGRRVLVIGSGFIGCELAASLSARGAAVTLISQERLPQLDRLGSDAASMIASWLAELDVELLAGVSVEAIRDGRAVELADGRRISGESVVIAAGVRPRGELAAAAGLPLRDGAVVVDSAMRAAGQPTTVLAVGDLAYGYNESAGRHLRVEHWGDALAHGAIAGASLAGGDARWDGVPGFWSTIGEHTLKYAAWGDGYDDCLLRTDGNGSFTVWYSRSGAAVGVLTHDADEDYELGGRLIAAGEPAP
jgi:NADPH-dependent 2,4-dienoyl-CoA reductase/sulfur reductase-like enzyme